MLNLAAARPCYEHDRAERSLLITEAIHSPKVPWLRPRGDGPLLEREPDAGADLAATFARRWANVLAIAADRGHRNLVLGAWGCGAFRSDPIVTARTARDALMAPRAAGHFDRVVFAIPRVGRQGTRNHDVFRTELLGG